ncbi:MAG: BrnT family toxin [Anaerolineales bacterium]|nr:MAG: BrnT family toxin [Anaerolineales bacterium]
MKFEWDENKRRANIRKHGIDFVDAASIFDGDVVVILDDRFEYGEARYIAFGLLRGKSIKVIVVAYTERGGNVRIISARKALKHEESFYFEQIAD